MNTRSTPSSQPSRAGFTLVEVLAALALIATVLVQVLLAGAALDRRSSESRLRLRAAAALDRMLAGWSAEPNAPALVGGDLDGLEGCTWTAHDSSTDAGGLHLRITRVQVFTAAADRPLLELEIVTSADAPAPADGGE